MSTDALSRLAAALADRYRIELAATHVAARHTIASRLVGPGSLCNLGVLPARTGSALMKSQRDDVPSSDVSRGMPMVNS